MPTNKTEPLQPVWDAILPAATGDVGTRGPLSDNIRAAFPPDARAQWLAFCWMLTGTGPGTDPEVHVKLLGEREDIPRRGPAPTPDEDDGPRQGTRSVQARRLAGPASELWPRLQTANARGWAVYVQVNAPTPVQGRARWTKDRFPVARAVVAEIDAKALPQPPLTPQQQAQAAARANMPTPEPTMVVLSRGGPHVWWTLPAPGLPAAVAEQLSSAAAELLGADPTVFDRARVLRAPGFFHWKADPFFVRLVGGTGAPVDPYALASSLPAPTVPVAPVDPVKEERYPWAPLEGEERAWALQQCARLLVELGPSVEGKGGDNHLYRRVIPALQDHGLTWADALPLLHGWNATCQPPWPLDTLREKWRRALDVREDGPRAVELRRFQAAVDELVDAATAARESLGAPRPFDDAPDGTHAPTSGASPTQGPPRPPRGPRALAEVHYRPGAGLLETVQDCLRLLAEPLGLWDFNGVLARTAGQRLNFGLGGRDMVRAHLQAHVQLFTFTEDSRRKRAPLTAYKDVATCIAQMEDVTGLLPAVRSVCLHPQALPDGDCVVPLVGAPRTVHDRGTGTVFLLSPSKEEVGTPFGEGFGPADALRVATMARDALMGLVVDFPFAAEADRSAWLATLLTVFFRRGIAGPAPLFLFEGNQAGAGKTLLADVVLAIQGDGYASTHWQGDAYQDTAQLFGAVQNGASTMFLDNVAGQFGDAVLDKLLTGERFSGRLLGGATQVTVDTGGLTWLVTGNNLIPRRDLARRTLRCSLVNTTAPDARRRFKHPNLIAHVRENRAFYQSCVLSILGGYIRDGAPPPPADHVPFRSFDGWTRWVRGVLAWLGMVDVFEGVDNENLDRAVLGDDESETELERDAVVRAVLDTCGATPKGSEELLVACSDPMATTNPALGPLLALLKTKKLPYLLRTHHRAVSRDGWQLKSTRKSRWAKRLWFVERVWMGEDGGGGGSGVDSGSGAGVVVGANSTTTHQHQNVIPIRR